MHTANLGDRVRIQYVRVPEPSASTNRTPVRKTCEFTVGGREVFRSLSLSVVGMAPGDCKRLKVQPREAYGPVQRKLVRQVPRDRFPKHLVLQVGKRLIAAAPASGRRRRIRIVKINPDSVLVDGNHPLAGKVVELEVSLISIDSSSDANRSKPQFDMGGES
jgi:FKBP-type peptidyl-prolyl cis-trans isomerase 2